MKEIIIELDNIMQSYAPRCVKAVLGADCADVLNDLHYEYRRHLEKIKKDPSYNDYSKKGFLCLNKFSYKASYHEMAERLAISEQELKKTRGGIKTRLIDLGLIEYRAGSWVLDVEAYKQFLHACLLYYSIKDKKEWEEKYQNLSSMYKYTSPTGKEINPFSFNNRKPYRLGTKEKKYLEGLLKDKNFPDMANKNKTIQAKNIENDKAIWDNIFEEESGNLDDYPIYDKISKNKKQTNKCPNGFRFGYEYDKYEDCADCDLWEDCEACVD